ncbi:MAG TPA: TadE/TadG family type IV pilus assembly protein [Verrucomicrobiae bacterium]|nr:TadE/TadG family type IV pilus assembly protein [Verrucomicrobiae bacterium]
MPSACAASNGGVQRTRRDCRAGSAAVEFAIVAPVLLLLMTGILAYGGYFLTAHTVQQMANDAARASLAGVNDDERTLLAQQAIAESIAGQSHLHGENTLISVVRDGDLVTVRVTYDASDDIYWAFAALLPTPSPRIERAARIRLGGLW